jgi:hypothetical protein
MIKTTIRYKKLKFSYILIKTPSDLMINIKITRRYYNEKRVFALFS